MNILERECSEGVAVLRLNRPERHNAIDGPLREALSQAFAWAEQATEVRAILLCGAGRSFCSGREISEMGQHAEGQSRHAYFEALQQTTLRQFAMTKPMVAALHGAVFGAGAELALIADVRIAADNMAFALPEVKYGVAVDTGGSALAAELAGPARAKWLLMSGEKIDATTALAWGLAEWVIPLDDLQKRALALARTLAAQPPEAVRQAKKLVHVKLTQALQEGMRLELAAQTELFAGEEYAQLQAAAVRSKS